VELLTTSDETNGWGYRCQLSYTTAVAMRGLTNEANSALLALEKWRHAGWRYLDYEFAIACAWVAACQGAVSEAISVVLSAAQTARDSGQFAAEVMCLQTAAQFGDGSGAPRLGELRAVVEGPRVGVAARFATAVHAGDGPELVVVSEEFEAIGDVVAAADAAAHAALAFRRNGLRGSALRYSKRADDLAERCGGACTPAVRQASERLPLTPRQREIAMLLRAGLSSPAIARRLTLAVRSVEGHIYRAMAATGTTSREELAALLGPHGQD
jgi:DNA-binding CsgD family transcriptional regulator